eukprot:6258190-Lingulodinium_polyedra.AAC.1
MSVISASAHNFIKAPSSCSMMGWPLSISPRAQTSFHSWTNQGEAPSCTMRPAASMGATFAHLGLPSRATNT